MPLYDIADLILAQHVVDHGDLCRKQIHRKKNNLCIDKLYIHYYIF